jgi:hypothetical protein
MGIQISIDDYGTGNATLDYLKTFPCDEVKIDRKFVTHVTIDADDRLMVDPPSRWPIAEPPRDCRGIEDRDARFAAPAGLRHRSGIPPRPSCEISRPYFRGVPF